LLNEHLHLRPRAGDKITTVEESIADGESLQANKPQPLLFLALVVSLLIFVNGVCVAAELSLVDRKSVV
jgi:hypothetical protein